MRKEYNPEIIEQHVKIICDQRELNSGVVKALEKLNADYSIVVCEVGDYILSDRVAVERKSTVDFLSSWLEGRELFSQLIDLAKAYERPLLIIEGIPEELYTLRRINPKSIDAVLDTIAASLRVPIIYTLNSAETAQRMYHIAEREQNTEDKRYFSQHGKRSHLSPDELKTYIVSAIPGLGTSTAIKLLQKFGSIKAFVNAEPEQLAEVEQIGLPTARKIKEILEGEYNA